MIEYINVNKFYNNVHIIKDLNLKINNGELVALIGPSGCGKTTTLKLLNRLISMDSGEILIDGKKINQYSPELLRRNVGYVIQDIGLFPHMTIEKNISIVPRMLKWSKEKCDKRVRELLKLVNMDYDTYAHKFPYELSGGQQQRIGVLRALAANPPIVLMDEPFGALDPLTRHSLQEEVMKIQKKLHITLIFVTHDMNEAVKMADKIAFMSNGELVQYDIPDKIISSPANDIVKTFMEKYYYH